MKKIVLILLAFGMLVSALKVSKNIAPIVSKTPALISQAPSQIATPTSSNNIEIVVPKKGDLVSSSLSVMGNARSEGNVVYLRVVDGNGIILSEDSASVISPSAAGFGTYEDILSFNPPSTSNGTLEAYQISSLDGSEVDTVIVPIRFK